MGQKSGPGFAAGPRGSGRSADLAWPAALGYKAVVRGPELIEGGGDRPAGWSVLAAGGLLVAATLAAYLPAFAAGYVWDDELWLTDNPLLTAADGWGRIWFSREFPQYYPLVLSTFRVERLHLWGQWAGGYHAVNVALHAINALLIWRLLRRLGVPGAWWAAAIFALHPVHTESVAWITERKNVLSGMFYLLAMSSYLRFEDRRRLRWYLAACGLFILALLSKTVTCSLPIVLLLVHWWQGRRIGWKQVGWLLPMVFLGVLAGLNTADMEVDRVRAYGEAFAIPYAARTIIAAKALIFYVGKLLAPIELTFIYPRWSIDPGRLASYWPVAVVAAGAAAVLVGAFRRRGLAAAGGFFVITLFPALGFFNLAPMRFSFVADHFQYLASVGVIVFAVAATAALFQRVRILAAVLGLVLLAALGTMTFAQSRIYNNRQTLFEDTVRKNPDGWMPRSNLGGVYFKQGRYDEALAQFEHILQVNPRSSEAHAIAHTNIGMILFKQQQPEPALDHLQQALEINPHFAKGHYNLGSVLFRLGRLDEAVACYQQAIELEPRYATAHCDLGGALLLLGQFPAALEHCRLAESIRPDYPPAYYNQVEALMQLRQVDAALEKYRQGVRLRFLGSACRNFADLLIGYARYGEAINILRDGLEHEPQAAELADALAWQYATCPNRALRRGQRALELGQQTCQAADYNQAQYLDTLAAAHAELGDFGQAAQFAQRAVTLAQQAGQQDLAKRIQGRVRLYLLHKPYRGPR